MALNMRGRHYRWNKKDTTDSYLSFDIATFAKSVDLTTARAGSWQWTFSSGRQSSIIYVVSPGQGVRLSYTASGQDYNYLVSVTTTTPHYGGARYWWLCPTCGRRVRILYGGKRFLCRHCHSLTYETAQKGGDLLTTIDNRLYLIRRRLQGKWSLLDGPGDKPKGMHWNTYFRLVREYLNLKRMRQYSLVAEICTLGMLDEQLVPSAADAMEDVQEAWREHKAQPDQAVGLHYAPAEDEPGNNEHNRLTLGDIAQRAGVPYAFALEAQQVGLVRADQGRGKRRRRYRERLKNWLHKLHTLRDSSMSWEDITVWSKRRFQPGHEHERVWPAGFMQLSSS
jgi:hypothetical protein